ncbi:hypothetical protein LZ023_23200 [Pseudomonas silvicola]|nr:hypothetical protein LZ023_23200 [Pseudomonas silvicola]
MMFFTHPSAELRPPLTFDLATKRWSVVERDLECPWFHLSLEVSEAGYDFKRTLLISDAVHLVHLLDELPEATVVNSLMVMTPPHLNRSSLWRLENVISFDIEVGEVHCSSVFIVSTELGMYRLPAAGLARSRRVYDKEHSTN